MRSFIQSMKDDGETIILQATEANEEVQVTELPKAIAGPIWGYYQGGIPPPFWSCLANYEMCAGTMQSPVNIETRYVVRNNKISKFCFSGLRKTAGIKMELKNTGLAVKVQFPDVQPIIKGGGLPGPHKLLELHFHWGDTIQRGSEHLINGKHSALEAHFVFVPTRDDPKHFAAVIGVMIYAGNYNPNYEHIVSKLKDVKHIGDKTDLDNFPIMDLFPESTRCWYRYCGSLTTPPCREKVIWTVLKHSISMSEDQISEFLKLMGEPRVFTEGNNNIVDTFRPVQPLLQRKVSLSCPRRGKYYYEQNRRNANEYGCINHGYGKQECHKTYYDHSAQSNICLWVDWYRSQLINKRETITK
ncbi:carbonic anhydrase 1-like [Mytilus edulis]|uniref:carbonic anhydrase 1-like n=1 Tax=Mytilus edulis TaxID=6550 RepID=UPI0039EFA419